MFSKFYKIRGTNHVKIWIIRNYYEEFIFLKKRFKMFTGFHSTVNSVKINKMYVFRETRKIEFFVIVTFYICLLFTLEILHDFSNNNDTLLKLGIY